MSRPAVSSTDRFGVTLLFSLIAHGVLVRSCDTIPGMPPGFIRMQVRSPEELAPLYAALARLG